MNKREEAAVKVIEATAVIINEFRRDLEDQREVLCDIAEWKGGMFEDTHTLPDFANRLGALESVTRGNTILIQHANEKLDKLRRPGRLKRLWYKWCDFVSTLFL